MSVADKIIRLIDELATKGTSNGKSKMPKNLRVLLIDSNRWLRSHGEYFAFWCVDVTSLKINLAACFFTALLTLTRSTGLYQYGELHFGHTFGSSFTVSLDLETSIP